MATEKFDVVLQFIEKGPRRARGRGSSGGGRGGGGRPAGTAFDADYRDARDMDRLAGMDQRIRRHQWANRNGYAGWKDFQQHISAQLPPDVRERLARVQQAERLHSAQQQIAEFGRAQELGYGSITEMRKGEAEKRRASEEEKARRTRDEADIRREMARREAEEARRVLGQKRERDRALRDRQREERREAKEKLRRAERIDRDLRRAERDRMRQERNAARERDRNARRAAVANARAGRQGFSQFRRMHTMLGQINRRLFSTGRLMLAAFGIGTLTWGLRNFLGYLGELQLSYNRMKLALGSMLQNAGFVDNWKDASHHALVLRDVMRQLSRERPGSLDDWMRAARDIMAVAEGTGMTTADVMKMTENAVASQLVYGLKEGTVGFDIRQLMMGQGNARAIQTPTLRRDAALIAALARDDQKSLAKMGRKDLVGVTNKRALAAEMIGDRLRIDPQAREEFGRSFEAQLDTFKDNLNEFFRRAGLPLFESVTAKLREWNGWLTDNGAKVKEIAATVGDKLLAAAQWVYETVKGIAEHWDEIVLGAKMLVGTLVGTRLLSGLAMMKFHITGQAGLLPGLSQAASAATSVGSAAAQAAAVTGSAWAATAASMMAALAPVLAVWGLIGAYQYAKGVTGFHQKFGRSITKAPGGNTHLGKALDMIAPVLGIQLALEELTGTELTNLKWAQRQVAAEKAAEKKKLEEQSAKDAERLQQQMQKTLGLVAGSAANGATVHNDLRGSKIEVKQDLRGEDPDAVFLAMNKGIAREVLAFVTSPYSPG